MSDPASAGISLLGDLYGAYQQRQASKDSNRSNERMLARQLAERKASFDDVTKMYRPYKQMGDVALGDLRDLAYDESQYATPDPFQFGGTIDDYLDPSMDFQQEQMRRQIEASASAGGGLLSGATLKELQRGGAQLAQTDYQNAFNRMQTEQKNAYQEYLDQFKMVRQANTDRWNRLGQLSNQGINATQNMANARTGLSNNTANIMDMQGNASQFGATIDPTFNSSVVQSLTNPNNTAPFIDMFRSQTPQNPLTQPVPQMSNPFLNELNPSLMAQQGNS